MLNYKLNLLIPQEFMCVPSCILLILDRKSINVREIENLETDSQQFYLASKMDLRIPENMVKYFEPLKDELEFTVSEDKKHNGCNIVDLNKQIFEPLNIPLKEEFHSIRNFMYEPNDILKIIKNSLDNDDDVIVFLDYCILTHNEADGPRGHSLLISDIDIEKKKLTLTNPITEREVVVEHIELNERFIRSMESFGYGGGISIIKKLENQEP